MTPAAPFCRQLNLPADGEPARPLNAAIPPCQLGGGGYVSIVSFITDRSRRTPYDRSSKVQPGKRSVLVQGTTLGVRMRRRHGFTLIELLVVIAIIAVLI